MDDRLTRSEVEAFVEQYRNVPRKDLPLHILQPESERDFNLALALIFATDPKYEGVTPLYDQNGVIVEWAGIMLGGKD